MGIWLLFGLLAGKASNQPQDIAMQNEQAAMMVMIILTLIAVGTLVRGVYGGLRYIIITARGKTFEPKNDFFRQLGGFSLAAAMFCLFGFIGCLMLASGRVLDQQVPLLILAVTVLALGAVSFVFLFRKGLEV